MAAASCAGDVVDRAAVDGPAHERVLAGAANRLRRAEAWALTATWTNSARRSGRRCCARTDRTCPTSGRCSNAAGSRAWRTSPAAASPRICPRTLPEGCGFSLDRQSWTIPPLFAWLQRAGQLEDAEMFRAFNMGVGLVAVCAPEHAAALLAALGPSAWRLGGLADLTWGTGLFSTGHARCCLRSATSPPIAQRSSRVVTAALTRSTQASETEELGARQRQSRIRPSPLREAAPGPVLRAPDQAGRQGVPFDVAADPRRGRRPLRSGGP